MGNLLVSCQERGKEEGGRGGGRKQGKTIKRKKTKVNILKVMAIL